MRTIKAIFVILTVGIMALAGYALVTGNRAAVLFLCWATLVDGMLKLISMVLTDDPPPAKPARLGQFAARSLKADQTVPIPPIGPIARMMQADDRTRRTY